MTNIRMITLITIATVGLTACSMPQFSQASHDEVFLITHTTKGTLYWE